VHTGGSGLTVSVDVKVAGVAQFVELNAVKVQVNTPTVVGVPDKKPVADSVIPGAGGWGVMLVWVIGVSQSTLGLFV